MEAGPSGELLAEMEATAVSAVREAGALLAGYFGRGIEVEYKNEERTDPVTAADREAQAQVLKTISERFPGHGILAEENPGTEDVAAPDLVWVVDPLDGTKNFASGLPLFACSIGVLYRGASVVGAVYVPWPNGGAVFHARRGAGARLDGGPVSTPHADQPTGSLLATLPGSFGAGYRFKKPMRGKVGDVRATGSIAFDLAMTAKGVFQFAVTTAPRLWDVAGGVALLKEAGGAVMVAQMGRRFALPPTLVWKPLDSFLSWQVGETKMEELRRWSVPLLAGSPGVARYVAANLAGRRPPLGRAVRRLVRRPKRRQ